MLFLHLQTVTADEIGYILVRCVCVLQQHNLFCKQTSPCYFEIIYYLCGNWYIIWLVQQSFFYILMFFQNETIEMSNDSYLEDVGQSAAGSGQGAAQQVKLLQFYFNFRNETLNI